MKYFLPIFIITFFSCGMLQNGVSYSGQDKLFSKYWQGNPIYTRAAYGREPDWELGFAFKTNKHARLKGVWIKKPNRRYSACEHLGCRYSKIITNYSV